MLRHGPGAPGAWSTARASAYARRLRAAALCRKPSVPAASRSASSQWLAASGVLAAGSALQPPLLPSGSAAPYLKEKLGGKIAIGANITVVQDVFGKVFNAGTEFERDGSQFDALFKDGDRIRIGSMEGFAMHTPGHTPACVTYVFGDAAFIGDTLFMPDYGTARADFPGGSARDLYRSIRKVLALPPKTRLFLCHDYKAPGRDSFQWETTVAEQRASNVHVHDGVTEDQYVAMREARDKTLGMPKLIIPSIQVNMRAGDLPDPEDNGVRYLKVPLNRI
jgi:glyoxylase-like metal-dependent hydrolase (beta-lactamase superfamily II)